MGEVTWTLKVSGAIALAGIISALMVVAVTPARPKQPPAATKLQDEPAVKGVRIVPIVRKFDDRIPIESLTVGDITIEKSPPRAAAQKADVPLPPLPPPAPPLTTVATAPPPEAALPESEPEVHRHWHAPPEHHHHHEHHAANASGDICAAHHLHKVFSNNGKSWHCRPMEK